MKQLKEDLMDTLLAFRKRYGVGRAIAAPQIGVRKRVIYRHLDTPVLFINPCLTFPDREMMEVLDDHLDGILATLRAVDEKALVMKPD